MEFYAIRDTVFMGVMSRYGKVLREEVFRYCIKYGTAGQNQTQIHEFCNKIISGYNPIVWESAIFYAHPSEIFNAVERATSTSGNIKGGRKKDVDWLKIATEFDYNIWYTKVKNRREGGIAPQDFVKLAPQFSVIYKSITNWMLSDFGYTTLLSILDISRRYSSSIVNECISMVNDPKCKSIEYLLAVMDKELAVRRAQMLDNKELLDYSKKIIDGFTNMVSDHSKPIDWDSIDETINIDAINKAEFDKVKSS